MKSSLIGFMTACVVAALLLSGVAAAEVVDRVVAIVNNDIILLSDLQKTLAVVAANLDRQNYPASSKEQILKAQRKKIVEQLIYDKLTDQQVQRLGIKIGDEEVDATIAQIRKVNKMTDDDLRRALELDGITYEAYRKQIRDKILRTRLVNREVKSKIVVTDEEIGNYYKAHRSDFGGSTKYDLRHILLRVSPSATPKEKEAVHKRIEVVYERLQNGEPFAELAREVSEASSADRNGSLGVFDVTLLSDPIRKALKGLEPEQYSKIVETDQGYQIFYVDGITEAGGRSLEDVRGEIQQKLYANDVDQKFNAWMKELRKRSHIQILE